MKIVKPSVVELIPENPIQHIERCGRVCYKSEDKITPESAEKFVGGIVKRGHLSVTEHFRFILEVSMWCYRQIMALHPKYLEMSYDGRYLISGSSRGFIDLYNTLPEETDGRWAVMECINSILKGSNCSQALFPDFKPVDYGYVYDLVEQRDLTLEESYIHGWHTLLFTCDRGVSHELVRHRPCSFSQESTRYCNYSGDKFGNELTFIQPCFWERHSEMWELWKNSCSVAETQYLYMMECGATPQEARSVLPNSLKTELVITATNAEWLHVLELRCSPAAHPQAREVCEMALGVLAESDPEIFAHCHG